MEKTRQAGQRTSGRSGLSLGHLLVLVVLLAPPGWALYRGLGPTLAAYAGGWVSAVSLLAVMITWIDKRRAEEKAWREPENMLHLLEFLGGWPGAFLAQRLFRHKTAKTSYQAVFWFIVLLHEAVAADWLLGWPVLRALGSKL